MRPASTVARTLRADTTRAALRLLALLALGACGPLPAGEPDDPSSTEGETDPVDSESTGDRTTDTGDPTADTGDPTTADTGDPTTDGGESEDSGTTGEPPDTACVDTHPDADATAVVDWSQWPEVPRPLGDYQVAVEFDVPCTITAVDPAAAPVVTELECDDAGTLRDLSITIPATESPVPWAVGDAVQVAFHYFEYSSDYGIHRDDVTMRRADDNALLLASMNQELLFADTFAPVILLPDDDRCAPPGDPGLDDTWNLVVGFDNGAGAIAEVGHMQRGTLAPAVGDGTFAIDVGEARHGAAYCCHASRELEVLIRRTE